MKLHRNSTFSLSSTAARRRILSLAGLAGAAFASCWVGVTPICAGPAADTFIQNTTNNTSTNTNFWTANGNWSLGSPAGVSNAAVITASGSGTYYNADLNGTSETVNTLSIGAGSNIYNSGTTGESLTIALSSGTYTSTIAGNIGSTTGTLPGGSVASGGSGGSVTLIIAGGTNSITGTLYGNFALTANGGITTLSGANTYTGDTTINSGTLALSGSGSIADSSYANVASGATLDISGLAGTGTTIHNLEGIGNVTLGSETLTINSNVSTVYYFGGDIAGTGGVTVAGTYLTFGPVFNGTNTYTGATTVSTGTLGLYGTGSIADSSGVAVASGAYFDISGASTGVAIQNLSGGGTASLGGKNLTVSVASGDSTFSGIIENTGGAYSYTTPGGLIKNGAGTLTLSGANTYTGGTTINGGTLSISADNNLGGSAGGITFGGGTLQTTTGITDSRAITLNAGGGTIDTAGTSDTFSGAFTGSGGLTVTSSISGGTLTLSGANTYSGGTNLNAGTVSVSAGSNLGTGILTFNGGTLLTTAASTFSQGITVNAGGAFINTDGFTDTFNGFVNGSGTLTVTGGGTAVLNNSNGFGLGYAIEGNSTINLSGFGPGGNNNSVTFSGNTTQGLLTYGFGGPGDQLNNVTISDTNATTTNIIDAGNGTLPIDGQLSNSDPNATLVLRNGFFYFSGLNSGFAAGTLEITGSAILEVYSSADALGTGAILALNSGAVIDNTTGLTFTNAVVVDAGGGTLDTNNQFWKISGGISGSGNLTVESSTAGGTLILSGADTASGSITINSGTTLVFSGDSAGFTGNIADNSALIFSQTAASSLSGLISGSGTLMQDGTAALILSGANTYTGGTTISNGALIAANNAALGTGTVSLTGGTLETPLVASAGASGGNITLNTGTYTQSAGTTLGLALSGTPGSGNFDRLNVNGSAALAGTLDALVQAGAKPAAGTKASYNIITTTGGVSGNFSSITLAAGSSTGFSYSGAISGNDYVLTLSSAFSFNTALSNYTPTQLSVANYLDTVGNSGTLPAGPLTFLQSLAGLTPGQLSVALTEIAPNAYTNIPNTLINASIFNSQALNGQIAGQFEGGGFNDSGLTLLKTTNTDPFSLALASALQSNSKVNAATTSAQYLDDVMQPAQGDVPLPSRETAHDSFGGFIAGQAILGSQPTSTSGQNYFTGGINSGLDYRFAKSLLVGISFDYSYTNAHVDGVGSVLTDNSYAPGLFAGYRKDNFYADVSADYTYTQFSIHRNLNIGGTVSTATGKPDTNQADLNTLIGYNFPVCSHFKAGPAIGLDYTHVNVSSYSETGSPGDLSVSRYSIDSLRSLLGGQAEYKLMIPKMPMPLTISANAFWQHEYLNNSHGITAALAGAGSGSFITNVSNPGRDSALIGAGVSGKVCRYATLFANYEAQIGPKDQHSQSIMVGMAVSF